MVGQTTNETEFTCWDIKIGDQFLTFTFDEADKETKNFPYQHVMQFDVKQIEG
jgi:hypothetical protein